MTEASENGWLVRVRAQVMYRDETAEGWVPTHGGGGLAHVMIGRRDRPPAVCENDAVSAPQPPHEFFILGRRISDNSVVLECTIKKDFQYNKVMPTFHHWVTDEKRFGLTFQTAADARAFDKGVRTAVEELLDGLGGAWPTLHTYKKTNAAPKEEDEEQNIFECLNLPSDSRSSSETSTASRPGRGHGAHAQTPILSAITLPAHHSESIKSYEVHIIDKLDGSDGDRCPYVHLSAVHEYVYPSVGSEKNSPNTKPPLLKRDSGSIKKSHQHSYSSSPPPLPDKKPADAFQTRLRCKYCNELYLASLNRAGACSAAPDGFRACLERSTCLRAAQGMLYHCMARDEDGDFVMHPCACQPVDDNCIKRWLGIALLSLVVPCLWCYLPLRCIHRCARAAGCVSACHQPTTPPPNPNK